MQERRAEAVIPIQEGRVEGETEGSLSFLPGLLILESTDEIISVRRVVRQRGETLGLGLDAGALLRLICRERRMTTKRVYEEAKRIEGQKCYSPDLPELKYLDLGIQEEIFRWLTEDEREMLPRIEKGIRQLH